MCFMQGPKHRVGMYPDGAKFALSKGQTYRFDLNKDQLGDGYRVSLPHPDVMAALEVGWGDVQLWRKIGRTLVTYMPTHPPTKP